MRNLDGVMERWEEEQEYDRIQKNLEKQRELMQGLKAYDYERGVE